MSNPEMPPEGKIEGETKEIKEQWEELNEEFKNTGRKLAEITERMRELQKQMGGSPPGRKQGLVGDHFKVDVELMPEEEKEKGMTWI